MKKVWSVLTRKPRLELGAVWAEVQEVPASLRRAHSLLLPPMGPEENGADSWGSLGLASLWLIEARVPCFQLYPQLRRPGAALVQ